MSIRYGPTSETHTYTHIFLNVGNLGTLNTFVPKPFINKISTINIISINYQTFSIEVPKVWFFLNISIFDIEKMSWLPLDSGMKMLELYIWFKFDCHSIETRCCPCYTLHLVHFLLFSAAVTNRILVPNLKMQKTISYEFNCKVTYLNV